jgi:hypothetical protein
MLSYQELPTSIQLWRGHSQEAKIGEAGGPRITRNLKRLGRFSSRVRPPGCSWSWCGATPRGQPWTPAVPRPQGCDGLSMRRMAVLWPVREPSLGRQVHRELLRNAWRDFALRIPATACHQRNYVGHTVGLESISVIVGNYRTLMSRARLCRAEREQLPKSQYIPITCAIYRGAYIRHNPGRICYPKYGKQTPFIPSEGLKNLIGGLLIDLRSLAMAPDYAA